MNSVVGTPNYKFRFIFYPVFPFLTPLTPLKGRIIIPLRGGISPLGVRGSAGCILLKPTKAIYYIVSLTILILLTSCEEVINVDLNSADPAFVVEAKIYKDSVSLVRLTETTSYFSPGKPGIIENAHVKISDGTSSDVLEYAGDGYYRGDTITGTEETTYEIEINHDGMVYKGTSTMLRKADIISVWFSIDESQSVYNPYGKKVLTITSEFRDNPETDNFYMIRLISDGNILESYFLLDEKNFIDGVIYNSDNNTISYSESVFEFGSEVEVQVFSIDESIYNYFMQLNDVLFWKRRVMPPTPYNPVSNIDNGALGYFAAWAYDSEMIVLE